jgi:Carboxypeptidase regulatory-like domain
MTWELSTKLLATGVIAAAIIGCSGDGRSSVAGKVTGADGAPIVGATIIARSGETGASASGETGSDGSYELGGSKPGDGVPPGNYAVRVVGQRKSMQDDAGSAAKVPARYSSQDTSGLSFTVEPGEAKQFDIKLDAS